MVRAFSQLCVHPIYGFCSRNYLGNHSDSFPQRVHSEILNIMSCHKNSPINRIVKAIQQAYNGGFSKKQEFIMKCDGEFLSP